MAKEVDSYITKKKKWLFILEKKKYLEVLLRKMQNF